MMEIPPPSSLTHTYNIHCQKFINLEFQEDTKMTVRSFYTQILIDITKKIDQYEKYTWKLKKMT